MSIIPKHIATRIREDAFLERLLRAYRASIELAADIHVLEEESHDLISDAAQDLREVDHQADLLRERIGVLLGRCGAGLNGTRGDKS